MNRLAPVAKLALLAWLSLLSSLFASSSVLAQHYLLKRVSTSKEIFLPIYTAVRPDDEQYLYVSQSRDAFAGKSASIKILDAKTHQVLPDSFLTINNLNGKRGEDGLRGLAFDPNFDQNGYFYIHYVREGAEDGISTVSRFHADSGLKADPASEQVLMEWARPHLDHTSGAMTFGRDGMLYIASGDDLQQFEAQKTQSYFGKILRIDVRTDDFPDDPLRNYGVPADNPYKNDPQALPEIYATGLRNPWTMTVDRQTGDLFIGDAGEHAWEEIDMHVFGTPGGQNFGWSVFEGPVCYNGGIKGNPACDAIDHAEPAYTYPHTGPYNPAEGDALVIAGYVYHGPIQELQGQLLATDYVQDNFYSLEFDRQTGKAIPGSLTDLTNRFVADQGVLANVWDFGEDGAGNVYLLTQQNEIFVIDSVLLPGDGTLDGKVDLSDFGILKAGFGSAKATLRTGDFTADGKVDLSDFGLLKENFGTSKPVAAAPEPSSLALAALAAALAVCCRAVASDSSARREFGRGGR